MLEALAEDLRERGEVDLSRMLYRRHVRRREKRGRAVGKTKRGKGTKLMVVADNASLPLAAHAASASPHEVTLVGDTLLQGFTAGQPERLIGDKAYDSDPLDAELAERGIELIAPHRSNRKKPRDAGRAEAEALQAPLEGRAAKRMAPELPPGGDAL